MRTFWTKLLPLILLLSLSGCGYNAFQSLDEEAKASWSEVLNQYQRRADLVPNLVNVVKGYAAHEKEVKKVPIHCASQFKPSPMRS